ncbi:hypothetical protein ACM25P_16640 [Vreelandella alkaliphila]|uniref:hypothetical protein n=1 Tax=Vreelandella alkaliphila TaxID=272774 RepID=UPI0039F5D72B
MDKISELKKCMFRVKINPQLLLSELINIDKILGHNLSNFSKVDANFDKESFDLIENKEFVVSRRHLLKGCEGLSYKKQLEYLYDNAQGVELNAINIVLANYARDCFKKKATYLYFLVSSNNCNFITRRVNRLAAL